MIVINFSHPFTDLQHQQIEQISGAAIEQIINITTKINSDADTGSKPQIIKLIDSVGLTSEEWQTIPIIINPPGLASAALTLLAELHGRMGGFPTVISIRPIPDSTPTIYEVAELINLQSIRNEAREERRF